jgi:hypothetical protein
MMCFNVSRHFLLTCSALFLSALLFAACGTTLNLEKTPTAPSLVQEFSSAIVAGEEITLSPGQAVVLYADHLPQAGGSGDEAVSKAALHNQLNVLAHAAPFAKIAAVWGLSNHCTYAMYVDVYYLGTLRLTVVDAKLAHHIIVQWRTKNHVTTHYTSENDIPCLAA